MTGNAMPEAKQNKHHEVTLHIATPKGPFKGVFEEATTVATVIDVVVNDKHLDNKDTFELVYHDHVLAPATNTLKMFGLEGNVKLTLVAQGTGV